MRRHEPADAAAAIVLDGAVAYVARIHGLPVGRQAAHTTDLAAQTRLALSRLGQTLAAHGLRPAQITQLRLLLPHGVPGGAALAIAQAELRRLVPQLTPLVQPVAAGLFAPGSLIQIDARIDRTA